MSTFGMGKRISLEVVLVGVVPAVLLFGYLKWQSDANAKDIVLVREDQKAYVDTVENIRQLHQKLANDVSEIKGELKRINRD